MQFEKITTAEKLKLIDKMIKQVKKAKDDDDLYQLCKFAGIELYELMRDKIINE